MGFNNAVEFHSLLFGEDDDSVSVYMYNAECNSTIALLEEKKGKKWFMNFHNDDDDDDYGKIIL